MAHVNDQVALQRNNKVRARTPVVMRHSPLSYDVDDIEYHRTSPLRHDTGQSAMDLHDGVANMQPLYGCPPVDDFDSYMFPESDSQQSSPTEPSLQSHPDPITLRSSSPSPPFHHHMHYHHHHHHSVERQRPAHPSSSSSSSSYSYYHHQNLEHPFYPYPQVDMENPISNTHAPSALYDPAFTMVNYHSSLNTPPATLASTATNITTTTAHTNNSVDLPPSSLPSSSLTNATATDTATRASTEQGGPSTMAKEIDWDAVDRCTLYTQDGSSIDPTHLYTGYTTFITLIFVPRDAVELCALVYAKLAHLLQQASSRLVFITSWTSTQANTFLSRFEKVTPFPGPIICDPSASLFHAVNLVRSPLRALFAAPRLSAPVRQGVRNAISSVGYRAQNRDIARNTTISAKRLKAGAVVVRSLRGYSKRPEVVYAAEEEPSTGVGCYMDVLDACGVNDAFVPDIDVAQLYSRFNSMRAASQKSRYADEREASRANAAAAAAAAATAAASSVSAASAPAPSSAVAGSAGGTGKLGTRVDVGRGIESQSVTSTITATTTSMTAPRISNSPGAKSSKGHQRSSRKTDRRNALKT